MKSDVEAATDADKEEGAAVANRRRSKRSRGALGSAKTT